MGAYRKCREGKTVWGYDFVYTRNLLGNAVSIVQKDEDKSGSHLQIGRAHV